MKLNLLEKLITWLIEILYTLTIYEYVYHLVDTPERGDPGFKEETQFVVKLCLGENAEVDIDDGQRRGSFGREIGVVYCDGENLNEQLMEDNLGIIDTRFCEKSEFSNDKWG